MPREAYSLLLTYALERDLEEIERSGNLGLGGLFTTKPKGKPGKRKGGGKNRPKGRMARKNQAGGKRG